MTGVHPWNASLFGCLDDWGSCCYGYWCTPCLFGSNAVKINGKSFVGMCCVYSLLSGCYCCWIPHRRQRKALREKFNLREDPSCGDCLATVCCGPCAICQEAREMKSREKNDAVYKATGPNIVSQPASAPRGVSPNINRS